MDEPGWYVDPDDPSHLRYWNGSAWTYARSPLEGGQPMRRATALAERTPRPVDPAAARGVRVSPDAPPRVVPEVTEQLARGALAAAWLVLAGIWLAAGYVLGGVVIALTIVGGRFSVAAFERGVYLLWPFDREPPEASGRPPEVVSGVWLALVGWWLAAAHVVCGALLWVTVVGAPMGRRLMRQARLALRPFGQAAVALDS